jgi:Mg2+-importing ATPase
MVSSFFDLIFFGIFRKTSPAFLQTLWFVESIATDIALIYAIRTPRFFAKAKRPSLPLLILSVLAIFTTIVIPYTQFGQKTFHFAAPPYHYLLIVLFMVVLYFAASESVKLLYFRRWRNNHHQLI